MKKILGVALAVASIFLIAISSPLIYGLLVTSITLTSVGSVKTVGVMAYWDSSCTSEVSTIDWGTVEPGSTKNAVIYLKNNGSTPLTLSLDTNNWSPSSASGYISLSWDYSGEQIDPGAVVQVTLLLSVSSSISGIGSFTFDIIITGTG